MICGPWRYDLDPGVLEVLGRNPYRGDWKKMWRGIIRKDPCAYCGGAGGSIDHIVPKSRAPLGREKSWTNLTGACYSCNARRADAPLLLWLANPERAVAEAKKVRRRVRRRRRRQTRAKLLRALRAKLLARAWRLHEAAVCEQRVVGPAESSAVAPR